MPSDTWQKIWGPGTPEFFYREIDEEAPPADPDDVTYSYVEEAEPNGEKRRKRVSPSSIEDDALVKAMKVGCLNDKEGPFPQLITKAAAAEDDAVGTCIHNIFAVYEPGMDRPAMLKTAEDTIARHGLDGVLNSPEVVVTSAEILFKFLEETYGKAVRVEHELPFRELKDGQMTVGSIDLVWLTSEKECVLVDFKNLPGAGRNVLNPDDSRYLGHYAPQQAAYRDALVRGGYTVKACLLYLSMQGKVVELGM
jgi:ATP-dependent exoDNAse (exonuclease V) beta subunit